MKKTIKFLGALAICAATIACKEQKTVETVAVQADSTVYVAAQGAIVYVDLDVILARYDMANELSSVVETKIQNIQAEVTRRGKKLESAAKEFQEKMEKGLMTRSAAEVQAQKLQQQETDFNTYAAQKQQEIQEEQMVMMNQIGDAIKTFLDAYNVEKEYAMIITNSGGAPVITADEGLNITDDVLARLNEEYVESKNAKN